MKALKPWWILVMMLGAVIILVMGLVGATQDSFTTNVVPVWSIFSMDSGSWKTILYHPKGMPVDEPGKLPQIPKEFYKAHEISVSFCIDWERPTTPPWGQPVFIKPLRQRSGFFQPVTAIMQFFVSYQCARNHSKEEPYDLFCKFVL